MNLADFTGSLAAFCLVSFKSHAGEVAVAISQAGKVAVTLAHADKVTIAFTQVGKEADDVAVW